MTPRSTALNAAKEPPNFPMGVRTADAMKTSRIFFHYNPPVQTDELKILLALEPVWTVSVNGREFLTLHPSDIEIEGSRIRFGRYARRILDVQWLRPNMVRIHATSRVR